MSDMNLRVVKVGGSLFDLEDLGDRIAGWLARQSPAHTVFIAGGGPLVDVIRRADDRAPMEVSESHWLSIRAMRSSARRLVEALPEAVFIEEFRALRKRVQQDGVTVFDCGSFLSDWEPELPGVKLPQGWDVTSDSIAARLAIVLGAGEFALLKSTSFRKEPTEETRGQGRGLRSCQGKSEPIVDAFFDKLAVALATVRVVNLRSGNAQSSILKQATR